MNKERKRDNTPINGQNEETMKRIKIEHFTFKTKLTGKTIAAQTHLQNEKIENILLKQILLFENIWNRMDHV